MIVGRLYMYPVSPPVRSVILLEKALGIELEYALVNVFKGEQFQKEFLAICPEHTVPCYIDRDGALMWDSHAIMAFLAAKYAPNDDLYPKDLAQRAIVDQRLHFDSANTFRILRTIMHGIWKNGHTGPSPRQVAIVEDIYTLLEKFLEGQLFMAGSKVTIADFCLITSTTYLDIVVPIEHKFANLLGWIRRCESLPYYEEGNGKGLTMFKRRFV